MLPFPYTSLPHDPHKSKTVFTWFKLTIRLDLPRGFHIGLKSLCECLGEKELQPKCKATFVQ